MPQVLSSAVPTEWIALTKQTARLALRNMTVFAPGDPGHDPGVLDLADIRGEGKGLSAAYTRYAQLIASTVGEGEEYAGWQTFTPAVTSVTVSKQQVGLQLTKERRKKGGSGLDEWINAGLELAEAMATKVNVDVCSAFASFSSSTGSTGVDITNANILTARDALYTSRAKGPLHVVLHTHQWFDLMSEASSPLTNASINPLASGHFMQYFYDSLYGLRWFLTQDVQTANAGADRAGAMFTPEAIGMSWGQDFDLEVEWDKNAQLHELLLTCYYGVGIVDQNSGRKLVTDA